ncbi:hypothetical protein H6CHR_04808 [Variovorax sp. PBL-H6]|uniref:hypothetical protein n=1 Tax=Variovorax sp. PBL-H6 TaxID=434009 RepID=UPI0013197E65|nr:hypothetical protein [Variovorax sp. PBL-H6]VTU36841.1 hypothetical protein H6CHR_04808 [Variovorax sp. PBL-H6]
MSILFGLKEWLTLEEAAAHLTGCLEEAVTEADILRLALAKKLTVSVDFINTAYARPGEAVPASDEVQGIPFNGTDLLVFEDRVVNINGIFDLPMIAGEIYDCHHKLQKLTGGPLVLKEDVRGAFVRSPSTGRYYQLLRYMHGAGEEISMHDAQRQFDKWDWKGRLFDDVIMEAYVERGGTLQSKPSRNDVFVVRRTALQAFVGSLLPPTEKPIGTKERDTLLTIIAALAKEAKIDIAKPSKAASLIQGMADQLGAPVSKRAIEEHLKSVPAAIAGRSR